MKFTAFQKYFFNCFLLTIPILVWNLIFADKLPKTFQPEIFWNDIPSFLSYGENISRTIMFIFICLMPIKISTSTQERGFVLYVLGMLIYFASWLSQIYFQNSLWSDSLFGFLAPAYTPIFWLAGIGLIGNSMYFNIPYKRWVFMLISIVFLMFHNAHTFLIYLRTH